MFLALIIHPVHSDLTYLHPKLPEPILEAKLFMTALYPQRTLLFKDLSAD